MEVALRFIALDNTKSEVSLPNRRVILNEANPTVDIGRSSKNISRGLKASFDNALWDSPILSRTHARVDFRLVGFTPIITLTDCGSTHGTFVEGQKLEAYIARTLVRGEKITFGVQVTNGQHVHAAKDFRISWILKRQDTLNDLSLSSPPVPTSPVSSTRVELGFRVPDDDDSSIEVQASREDSVQIVEPQVNTYSVPSSDDEIMICSDDSEIEDEGVAESVQSQEEEESAATTPESKSSESKKDRRDPVESVKSVDAHASYAEAKKAEVIDLLNKPSNQDFPMAPMVDLTETAPKKDSAGSSQKFPLDLRDRSPTPFPCEDTESEYEPDDGPEILPSKICRHKSPSPLVARLNQPFTGPEDMSNIDSLPANSPPSSPPPRPRGPTHATDGSEEMTLNSRIEGKSLKIIPETQAASIPARFAWESETYDTDESDSISSQDIDTSDVSDSDEDACNEMNEANDDEAWLRVMKPDASNNREAPAKKTGPIEKHASVFHRMRDVGDGFSSTFHVCPALDMARPRSLGADAQSHPRAPSPSDAAMAKKDYSQKAPEDTEHSMGKDTTSVSASQPQITSHLAPSPSDDSFFGPRHSAEWNPPKGPSGAPPTPYESDMFDTPWDTAAAQSSFSPNTGVLPFGLVDAYGSQPAMGINDADKIFNPGYTRGPGLQAQGFWPDIDGQSLYWPHVASPTSRYSYESNLPGNSQTSRDGPSTTEAKEASPGKFNPLHEYEKAQAERDAPSSNTSRLNISNLINEATANSPRISKKRKADDISIDEGDLRVPNLNEPSDTTIVSDPAFEHLLEESELPDAQIRGTPTFPPAALLSQDENLAKSGTKTPLSSSASSKHVSTDAPSQEPSQEPPRKKVKVAPSSSRAGGIARFVSGVAVGVVGVLATIIATAPISVQEEALREMTRGA